MSVDQLIVRPISWYSEMRELPNHEVRSKAARRVIKRTRTVERANARRNKVAEVLASYRY